MPWRYRVKKNGIWIPVTHENKVDLTYKRDNDEKEGFQTTGIYYASSNGSADAMRGGEFDD